MNPADFFETVVTNCYEPLFRFALSLTRSEADALDLTQQTFYLWATKGHQLRDASKVKSWLFTTLHRAFRSAWRRQSRFTCQDWEAAADEWQQVPPVSADRIDSSQVLPALAKVDEIYQAAVALFYLEDLSYKEIAAILEVPVGTVKSRISRGIAQLKTILRPDDAGASRPLAAAEQPAASPENESVPQLQGQHIKVSPWISECFPLDEPRALPH